MTSIEFSRRMTWEMEYINCPLCGRSETKDRFLAKDRYTSAKGDYRVVQCRNCEMVYVNPRPTFEALKQSYYARESPQESFKPVPETAGLRERIMALFAKLIGAYRVKWIEKRIPIDKRFRVLDVGCGYYSFLYALNRAKGCQVYGVDVNPDAVRYVKERLSLSMFEGPLGKVGFEDDFFDVVTAWHVIEHDANPLDTLRELERIVRQDGYLIVETPNVESALARLFKDRWKAAAVIPQHIVLYSPATLGKMLSQCGFEVIETAHVFLLGNSVTASMLYSLGFQDFHRPSVRNILPAALILLLAPINLVINWLFPDNVRVIARKRGGID